MPILNRQRNLSPNKGATKDNRKKLCASAEGMETIELSLGVKKRDVLVVPSAESETVQLGAKVTIRYTGKLSDGKVFDESARDGSETVSFILGDSSVTAGE